MTRLDTLFDQLWRDYAAINPQAQAIHDLLAGCGEAITNDHIALRTFDDPRVDLEVLSQAFTRDGYEAKDEYVFVDKKLFARHFEHPDPQRPKVFISHLELAKCSRELQEIVGRLLDQAPATWFERAELCLAGRPWSVSQAEYRQLAKESEYAAWMAAWGFRANHFTIFVNALRQTPTLTELNALIKSQGFALNAAGGEIKGSRAAMLEQSATLAAPVEVEFSDGPLTVPGCYYEFAQRHPQPDGRLFSGFVEKSADKIFESTDRR